jgi:hypothetical protein
MFCRLRTDRARELCRGRRITPGARSRAPILCNAVAFDVDCRGVPAGNRRSCGASCSTRRRPKGGASAPLTLRGSTHAPARPISAICALACRRPRRPRSPASPSLRHGSSEACHFDFKHSAPGGDDLCDEAQAAIVRGHYDMRRLVPLILVHIASSQPRRVVTCAAVVTVSLDTLLSLGGNPASVSPGCRGMRYHL